METLFTTKSRGACEDLCCICAEYGIDFSEWIENGNGEYAIKVTASSDEIASLKENEIEKDKFTITKL